MYERFTDRSRKVLQLANQEAQRFNHEYIGTEHVLIGLVKEGSGVAANTLKNLGIELGKVRQEVEKLIHAGPDMVTMGKLPQTPRTKKCIEHAMAWAGKLEHNYVGTEHLLLGLLSDGEATACKALVACGVTLESVREEILNLLGHTKEETPDRFARIEMLLELVAEEIDALKNKERKQVVTWTVNVEQEKKP